MSASLYLKTCPLTSYSPAAHEAGAVVGGAPPVSRDTPLAPPSCTTGVKGVNGQGAEPRHICRKSLKALPVICKFHIHRFKVIRLFKFWIKFKSYIFFMNL